MERGLTQSVSAFSPCPHCPCALHPHVITSWEVMATVCSAPQEMALHGWVGGRASRCGATAACALLSMPPLAACTRQRAPATIQLACREARPPLVHALRTHPTAPPQPTRSLDVPPHQQLHALGHVLALPRPRGRAQLPPVVGPPGKHLPLPRHTRRVRAAKAERRPAARHLEGLRLAHRLALARAAYAQLPAAVAAWEGARGGGGRQEGWCVGGVGGRGARARPCRHALLRLARVTWLGIPLTAHPAILVEGCADQGGVGADLALEVGLEGWVAGGWVCGGAVNPPQLLGGVCATSPGGGRGPGAAPPASRGGGCRARGGIWAPARLLPLPHPPP